MTTWFYLGCHEGPGHRLFEPGMHRAHRAPWTKLQNFDGLLPPQDTSEPYRATVTRLPSFGVSALAFWDYSVDKRGGSNSVIFAPSLTMSPAELLGEAHTKFPQVFRRLPEPVTLA